MLRGGGIPLIENKKFLGFLVSKFLGFNWFVQSFKDSKIISCFWKILIPYYQNSISCFLEDIDPIFKIFKNF